MKFDLDWKTLTSFLLSLAIIVVQYIQGVYADGVSGAEWLGLAAVLFAPAGLVALVNNTPWSPAAKAIVQQVSAVVIVLVQGVQGVYAGGISNEEWMGLTLILLTSLPVYFAPAKKLSGVA